MSIEIFFRLGIWALFLAIGESLCQAYVAEYADGSCLFYILLVAFSGVLFAALNWLGTSDLTRDMRELYAYDCAIQVVGLVLFLLDYSPAVWLDLNLAILLAKMARILWPGMNSAQDQFAGWPVFGLVGYFESRRKKASIRSVPGSKVHDFFVYGCLIGILPLALLLDVDVPRERNFRLQLLPCGLALLWGVCIVKRLVTVYGKYMALKAALEAGWQLDDVMEDSELIALKQHEVGKRITSEILRLAAMNPRFNPELLPMLKRLLDGTMIVHDSDIEAHSPAMRRKQMRVVSNKPKEPPPPG